MMKIRRLIVTILIACLAVTALTSSARAEPVQDEIVTMDEALTVANNWISLMIHNEGDWGGFEAAEVAEIYEFKRGDRILGYFCRVEPTGFIVVSLRKELAPVKAYSTRVCVDADSDEEFTEVIKIRMEGILDAIEQEIGPVQLARSEDVERVLETNHRPTWDELGGDTRTFKVVLESGEAKMDYQEGEELISSVWHQNEPYNRWCPQLVGAEACDHAKVGCVATAAAQIMRYWAWPPYGVGSPYNDRYDWPNMPDSLTVYSPLAQIYAVAELCYEVGKAAGTDYGCSGSDAWLGAKPGTDMRDAYEDKFRYNENTDFEQRWHYSSTEEWFNIIKNNINATQPLQYGLLDVSVGGGFAAHSMVADGWMVVGSTRFVHMNYGYGYTCTWEDITNLPGAEGMIRKIRPAPSLGSWLSGVYSPPSFPYRYFNRDATGHDATFDAGHYLQFLPGVTVKCTSPDGGKIQFRGWSTDNTYLFARGDTSTGIRIHSGHIYLYQNGSIRFDQPE